MLYIISAQIERYTTNDFLEVAHTIIEKAETYPTISTELKAWLDELKAKVAEVKRLNDITSKSQLTPELTNNDTQRDRVLIGLEFIVNGFRSSANTEEAAAAEALWIGMTSANTKVNKQANYITQTSQMDRLLTFLLDEHAADCEKLHVTAIVNELKSLNDRMHELIEGRIGERVDKVLGAMATARNIANKSYNGFIKAINSWAYLFATQILSGERPLAEFIAWANATIQIFKIRLLKEKTSVKEDQEADDEGDEEGDGESSEGGGSSTEEGEGSSTEEGGNQTGGSTGSGSNQDWDV